MSFGFSVSDFITVLQLANRVRKEWVDAPVEYASIRDETKTLDNILRNVDDLQACVALSAKQDKDLQQAVQSCERVLSELEIIVHKHGGLQHTGSDLRSRVKKTWSRIKLDSDDIRNLRGRLQSTIALLTSIEDSIQRVLNLEVKELVNEQSKIITNQHLEAVADWFASASFAEDQIFHLSQRSDDTSSWFFADHKYKHWYEKAGATLLCHGIPGAGKSVLAATVINDLRSTISDRDTIVVYYYCLYKRQETQDLEHVFSSIIRQLFQERQELPTEVSKIYSAHSQRKTRPSVNELKSLLPVLAKGYLRIFLIVDALDEYDNHTGQRDKLLNSLFEFQNASKDKVNLLVTTRQIPDIQAHFSTAPALEIKASRHDVEQYLDHRLLELPKRISGNTELCEEIKLAITDLVDGMFLLARLHFDCLQDKTTPAKIRKALRDLPQGKNALSAIYAEALQRIDNQLAGFRDLAHQVLTLITYAKRELKTDEIREAIAIDDAESWQDLAENLEDDDTMLGVCAGLVILDHESNVLRLVHYTTQEYLEQVREQWLPEGHTILARKCLQYLLLDDHGLGWIDNEEFGSIRTSHQLLDYAGKHYGFHVKESRSKEVEAKMKLLLNQGPHREFATQVGHAEESSGTWYFVGEWRGPLLTAVYFDVVPLIVAMIEEGVDPNSRQWRSESSLNCAARYNCIDSLKVLLSYPEIRANGFGDGSETPLGMAALYGNLEIVKLLASRKDVDINCAFEFGWTALGAAALSGEQEVVEYLLTEAKADIHQALHTHRTPLWCSVREDHPEIVRTLLEHMELDPVAAEKSRDGPLRRAVTQGYDADLSDCLSYWDGDDYRLLYWVLKTGNLECASMLLSRGIKINGQKFLPELLYDIIDERKAGILKFMLHSGLEKNVSVDTDLGEQPLLSILKSSSDQDTWKECIHFIEARDTGDKSKIEEVQG